MQLSSYDEQGRTKRPDIVIRLPEACCRGFKGHAGGLRASPSCEDEQARQVLMKQHVDAVKGQIKKLAEQDYDQLPDLRSLDFVLLFIPIESAFTLPWKWIQTLSMRLTNASCW